MNNLYKVISIIFQPLLIPTYAIIMLINMEVFSNLPVFWRWIAIAGTFVFTAVLPAVPIFFMMRRGDINDVFISKREERTMPYLFSFIAYVFWSMFMWRTMQFPIFIVSMSIGSTLTIVIIVLVNLKWKISAHLAGMGGIVGAIFGVCYRMAYNPLWFFVLIFSLSALVALSRLELKAHTPLQTLVGFLVGFVMTFLPCFFF